MGQNRIPESKTGRNREVDFISDLARLRCILILMATLRTRRRLINASRAMRAVHAARLTIPDRPILLVVSGWWPTRN
jgi:hypothetical protein